MEVCECEVLCVFVSDKKNKTKMEFLDWYEDDFTSHDITKKSII